MRKIFLFAMVMLLVFGSVVCRKDKDKKNDTDVTDDAVSSVKSDDEVKDNKIIIDKKIVSAGTDAYWQIFPASKKIMEENDFSTENLTAEKINKYGYKLYEQKNYKDAAELFRCAVSRDFNYTYAHYNRACMLSLLYGQGEDVNLDVLFTHLKRSLALDPKRVNKIKKDTDLDAVRELDEFKKIFNDYPLKTDYELELNDEFFVGEWNSSDGKPFIFEKNKDVFSVIDFPEKELIGTWEYDSGLKNVFIITKNGEKFKSNKVSSLKIIFNSYYGSKLILEKSDSEIHDAAFKGNLELLKKMISLGFDKELKQMETTPIQAGMVSGKYNIVKYLLEIGAGIGNNDFIYNIDSAIVSGNMKLINYLISLGFNPSSSEIRLNNVEKNSLFILSAMSKNADIPVFELLLQYDLNINFQNEYQSTALHWAARKNRKNICKFLIKKGADKSLVDDDGMTAYDIAEENEFDDDLLNILSF